MSEYIYIIREREFKRLNENTYKIGRTQQSNPLKRVGAYPKGSELILIQRVDDCIKVEAEAITQFTKTFMQRREYGFEYFTGDIEMMIAKMQKIIASCKFKTGHRIDFDAELKSLLAENEYSRVFRDDILTHLNEFPSPVQFFMQSPALWLGQRVWHQHENHIRTATDDPPVYEIAWHWGQLYQKYREWISEENSRCGVVMKLAPPENMKSALKHIKLEEARIHIKMDRDDHNPKRAKGFKIKRQDLIDKIRHFLKKLGQDNAEKWEPPRLIGAHEGGSPADFANVAEKDIQASNPLFEFIQNGNDEVDWIHEKGSHVLLSEFIDQYKDHCRQRGIPYTWKSDYYPFKAQHFNIVEQHICKNCLAKAVAGCCPNYSAKNRKRRKIIEDMKMIRSSDRARSHAQCVR